MWHDDDDDNDDDDDDDDDDDGDNKEGRDEERVLLLLPAMAIVPKTMTMDDGDYDKSHQYKVLQCKGKETVGDYNEKIFGCVARIALGNSCLVSRSPSSHPPPSPL